MYLFNLLILCACFYDSSQQGQVYNHYIFATGYHGDSYIRILELMRSYYEDACSRIRYMNPIRFMYEESPYYEMGYITGEIIERYRKVIENVQKPIRFKFYTIFDILKHVEMIQKLYFEIYHLTRMLHETPRKWVKEPEFVTIEKIAGPKLTGGRGIDGKGKKAKVLTEKQLVDMKAMQQSLYDQQRHREREKRRQRKKLQKIREAFLHGLSTDNKGEQKPYNSKWPLDYGWEIENDW